MKIQVGHSPDADDAFMFYALTYSKIDTAEFRFEHILRDIETLNRWALEKRLEVTALSVHTYAYVSSDYALLPHGASIGEKYGPIVVSMENLSKEDLKSRKIAVPGELTTAFLALSLCLGHFQYEVIPFDQIFDAVKNGKVDAGLIIHEGQLTYSNLGFQKALDLGEWWFEKTGLPLPLGVNAVRKDLGKENCERISDYLRKSIDYGLEHRKEAMQYAMKYSRDTKEDVTDRFVGMYVNHFTQDFGERGRQAVQTLLNEAHSAGITPVPQLEFVAG
jgi:1,4-dihydroxy-6-naphthoate synthase